MKQRQVLMNDFVREYSFLKRKLQRATENVLKNGWYVLGQNVQTFEKRFALYCGVKYCISVANGYDALYISLLALDIKPGDEVIVPTHSFIATALPVSRIGATPVFVDTDEYFHLDPKKVEQAITKRTKAIIPVHLYGQMADTARLKKIARKYNLFLIEDACQAHGASDGLKKAGASGDLGCFSFYPTKNLGAFGDGGAITTNSKELYEKCLKLRNYGQEVKYKHSIFGINSRLDELQAAILNEKLTVLDNFIERRQSIARLYIKQLAGVPEISLPKIRKGYNHVYHLFVIRTEERDALQTYLSQNGIQSMVHYPIPIHKQEAYKEYNNQVFPQTEAVCHTVLSLPLHPFLTEGEVRHVTNTIKRFFAQKRQKKTLTIGIPAFNEENNIESLIRSIQLQNTKSVTLNKILVVSDHSTDNTEAIVKKLARKDKRITLVRTKKRGGKCLALNIIYRLNTSDLLLTLDGDVVFENKDDIDILVKKISEKNETLVVSGNLTPLLPSQSFTAKVFYANHVIWNQIRKRIKKGNNIYNLSGQATLLKSTLADKVTYPHNISCDEFYLYLRAKQEHSDSFAYAENSRILTYPPSTLHDFRMASTRSIDERALLRKYFGSEAENEFAIDKLTKIKGILASVMHINPLYIVSSVFVNCLVMFLPYHDTSITNGLWIPVSSTKKKIRLQYS